MLGAILAGCERMVTVLVGRRDASRRSSKPTAGVIDSQSAPDSSRRVVRADMMRASVFTGANAMSSPTPMDFFSPFMFIRQTSRTARCSPIAGAIKEQVPRIAPRFCRSHLSWRSTPQGTLPLRSLDHRNRRATAWCQRLPASATPLGRGAHALLGLGGAAAYPRSSRGPRQPKSPGSSLRISGSLLTSFGCPLNIDRF